MSKFVHPPTEHPLKRNKLNQGDALPSPNIKQPPLDQFLFNSFPSSCSLLIFEIAISYTKEHLRKAYDEAQQTRKLQSVAKKWVIPPTTLYRRLHSALPRSITL